MSSPVLLKTSLSILEILYAQQNNLSSLIAERNGTEPHLSAFQLLEDEDLKRRQLLPPVQINAIMRAGDACG